MKKSHILMLSVALGLGACAGDEAVRPDAPADQTTGAETRGIDQPGMEGTIVGDEAGGATDAAVDASRTVHFDLDSASIDDRNRAIVEANARYMSENPGARVVLEGHTDERGTREYNLALGERRAQAVERMLRVLGVSADRVSTMSYGEEKPVAMGQGESAWSQNRRVEFRYQ